MRLKPLNIRDYSYEPALSIGDWACLAGGVLATILFISFMMTSLYY